MYEKGIYIFRRDFRLNYNVAFANAINKCKHILPVFIFTPSQITKNSYKSNNAVQFMIESLSDLEMQLTGKHGKLYTFYGDNSLILEIVFSMDGSILLTQSNTGTVRLWDFEAMKQEWQ